MPPSVPSVGSKVVQSKGDSDAPCPDVDCSVDSETRENADIGDSPGSTSASSSVSMSNGVPYARDDVLAHSYPVPVVVRNTFIDLSVPRSPSFDHFIQDRKTVSCPGSGLEPGARPDAPVEAPQITGPSWPATMSGAELENVVGAMTRAPAPPIATVPQAAPLLVVPAAMLVVPPWSRGDEAEPPAPEDPAVPGSPVEGTPSAGSALHGTGRCKPCAFVHTKGCESGASCVFCHLCDKGEKKRRQQAKRELRLAGRSQSSHNAWGW